MTDDAKDALTFKARVDGEWLENLSKGEAARYALYNLNGQTGEFSYSLEFSEDSGTHKFVKTQHFVNEAGDDVTDFVRQTVLHESASLSAVQGAIIESDSWNIRKEMPRGAAVSVDRESLPDNDPTPPRGNGGAAMARPEAEASFTPDDLPPSPNYEITEGGKVRIMDGAREAIERLAALVPEPTEADVTRHMMTGEEPRTVAEVKAAREVSGRGAAERAASQKAAATHHQQRTGSARGYDGPEL